MHIGIYLSQAVLFQSWNERGKYAFVKDRHLLKSNVLDILGSTQQPHKAQAS